jgi:hypothetical protein
VHRQLVLRRGGQLLAVLELCCGHGLAWHGVV